MRHPTLKRAGVTRRFFGMACALILIGAGLGVPQGAMAQASPASAGPADSRLIEDLVAANRILAD